MPILFSNTISHICKCDAFNIFMFQNIKFMLLSKKSKYFYKAMATATFRMSNIFDK